LLTTELKVNVTNVYSKIHSRCFKEKWSHHTYLYLYFFIGAKEMFQVACRTIFGAEASQISGLAFLSYCSAAGSLAQMIESNEGSAQEFKIKVISSYYTLYGQSR